MNPAGLHTLFARMGTRLRLGELSRADARDARRPLTLDVRSDADGKDSSSEKPSPLLAEFAVNLSGAIALFRVRSAEAGGGAS